MFFGDVCGLVAGALLGMFAGWGVRGNYQPKPDSQGETAVGS